MDEDASQGTTRRQRASRKYKGASVHRKIEWMWENEVIEYEYVWQHFRLGTGLFSTSQRVEFDQLILKAKPKNFFEFYSLLGLERPFSDRNNSSLTHFLLDVWVGEENWMAEMAKSKMLLQLRKQFYKHHINSPRKLSCSSRTHELVVDCRSCHLCFSRQRILLVHQWWVFRVH